MIQELSEKVWQNPRFQRASRLMESAWLAREMGSESIDRPDHDEAARLIRSAAILACSTQEEHRTAAYKIATYVYEYFGSEVLPLDQALRVVLARLGNFPAFETRKDVSEALPHLPLMLATEDLSAAAAREVVLEDESFYLTDFQHGLWTNLVRQQRVALSAPTSAGKSFVLQGYLASVFSTAEPKSIVYLVPTRALIAQVSSDFSGWFNRREERPEIVTVPLDASMPLPSRAVYVMTQERMQIILAEHPNFGADKIVVDEAQGIAEGARGILLQSVVDELLVRRPHAQILFASPSLRNLSVFGRLFGLNDVVEMSSVEPTVGQNFLIVDVEAATDGRIVIRKGDDNANMAATPIATRVLGQTTAGRVDKLVQIAADLGRGQSNIVYADGPADAEIIAIQLSQILSHREATEAQIELADLIKESIHPRYALIDCVLKGVAFHYSNIPTPVRRAVERATANGAIDYLVCTSTLLQGVNLPVKNIFMCYPKKGIGNALDSTDFWNLAGRAGRLRREFHGNIFLIEYDRWTKRPLGGPRDALVEPALHRSISARTEELINVIQDEAIRSSRSFVDLEATFVRLFADLKRDGLATTLERVGFDDEDVARGRVVAALSRAGERITLPIDVLQRSANISAHRQQRLYDFLSEEIAKSGRPAALALLPKHPREDGAYDSYAKILALCHQIILGLPSTSRLHRFHALIALFWMRGMPLPQIIQGRMDYEPEEAPRTIIRKTLDLIETQLRFQGVRLFGCYHNLLVHALHAASLGELQASIPSLSLFLEVGASDRTMISLVALGLSRVAAAKLNDFAANKRMDIPETRLWLRVQSFEQLGFSPMLKEELESLRRN